MLNKKIMENNISTNFVEINRKLVFFNEIVHHEEYKKIYSLEKLLLELNKEIKTNSARPFLNIPTNICKCKNIKPKDIIIVRLHKKDKIYEFISKVYAWGKIHVPKKIISLLEIKNNEKIRIQIIKETENTNSNETINLVNLFKKNKKIKTIKRANNFVTIYSEKQTPLTIPNTITINQKLVELFFLIHGDGHYKTKLFFVNKNPQLHKFVIKQFENELKIPMSIWRARVTINKFENEDLAKHYWKEKIGFINEQFYPKVSKTKFNTSKFGNLRICIDYLI
ncbi:MAG: hypothetical protein KJ597_04340, partial [Nanoarchaeota archaeon]|nr:hypothetical protein [Nanoarchaeota archaeon]